MAKEAKLALFTVLCVLFGLQLVSAQSFCQYQGNKGSYDLSVLTNTITAQSDDGLYNYYIQMCSTVTVQNCASLGTMVCQAVRSSSQTYAVAYPNDNKGQHAYTELDNGIRLQAFGDGCGNVNRVAQFDITCDPSVTGPITNIATLITANPTTCVYYFPFSHALACAGGSGGGGSSDGGSSGLSGGSVFLIIFFVSAFVYVAGGCFYKRYQKGTTGMIESCPNNEFWTAIPGLFKDGCLYTVRKLKSLCGGGGGGSSTGGTGTYETI